MVQITLQNMQDTVDNWIQSTDEKYFSELCNLGQLTEEVGEVARVMTRTYGQQNYKPTDTPQELADELADVMFIITCLANQTGINLTKAFLRNMAKKQSRKTDPQA